MTIFSTAGFALVALIAAPEGGGDVKEASWGACVARHRAWAPNANDAFLLLKCGRRPASNGQTDKAGLGPAKTEQVQVSDPAEVEPPPVVPSARDLSWAAEAEEEPGRVPLWALGAGPGGAVTVAAAAGLGMGVVGVVAGSLSRPLHQALNSVAPGSGTTLLVVATGLTLGSVLVLPGAMALAGGGGALGWWIDATNAPVEAALREGGGPSLPLPVARPALLRPLRASASENAGSPSASANRRPTSSPGR